jgi:hypothetical protein
MAYSYQKERPYLFTEEGVEKLLRVRDHAYLVIKKSGCARAQEILANEVGDGWQNLAVVDFLVEKKLLKEVLLPDRSAQYRIFEFYGHFK